MPFPGAHEHIRVLVYACMREDVYACIHVYVYATYTRIRVYMNSPHGIYVHEVEEA